MKTRTFLITAAALAVLAAVTVPNLAGQQGRGPRSPQTGVQLTEAEVSSILLMRQEEKLARDVYLTLYEVWGAEIFANISESEQRHMDAVERLITRYGLEDPVVDDAVGVFADEAFAALYDQFVLDGSVSLEDALHVGVSIEELDIADLEKALEETTTRSVNRVFENLLAGSQRHLSAFQTAIETGTTECPQQLGLGDGSCRACPECGQMLRSNQQAGNGGQNGNGTNQRGNGGNQNCNAANQSCNGTNQNANGGNQGDNAGNQNGNGPR